MIEGKLPNYIFSVWCSCKTDDQRELVENWMWKISGKMISEKDANGLQMLFMALDEDDRHDEFFRQRAKTA